MTDALPPAYAIIPPHRPLSGRVSPPGSKSITNRALLLAALAEGDQEARNAMYVDLQKKVQAESPIVIMFQAAKQVAMAGNVEGFVNGATSDFVYYRLVTKN